MGPRAQRRSGGGAGGFRARLDRSERTWNAALNRIMEGELFTVLLDASSEVWLTLNDVANETRRRIWHTLGLPTRDDVTNLARHLGELEDQLQRVERRLGRLGSDPDETRPAAGPGKREGRPRRTRKPSGAG